MNRPSTYKTPKSELRTAADQAILDALLNKGVAITVCPPKGFKK